MRCAFSAGATRKHACKCGQPSLFRARPACRTRAANSSEKVKVTGVGQLDIPVVAFEPVLRSIKMLVVPVVAADSQGNRCPGVQPYSFTLQVGACCSCRQELCAADRARCMECARDLSWSPTQRTVCWLRESVAGSV